MEGFPRDIDNKEDKQFFFLSSLKIEKNSPSYFQTYFTLSR